MSSLRASHVAIAQIGSVDGQPVHMNSIDGKNVTVAVEGTQFTVRGGGLNQSYPLESVARLEVSPDGSRFGLMAPGDITGFLVTEPGMHMVRVDARAFGSPKKAELRTFGAEVTDAVRRAGGSV